MVCKAVGRVPMAPCPYGHVPTSTGAVVSAGGMGQQVWVLKPFAAHPQNRNISTYKRAREGKKKIVFLVKGIGRVERNLIHMLISKHTRTATCTCHLCESWTRHILLLM